MIFGGDRPDEDAAHALAEAAQVLRDMETLRAW